MLTRVARQSDLAAMLHNIFYYMRKTSVMVQDRDGIVLAANPPVSMSFGQSSITEIIGKDFAELAQRDWVQERLEFVRECLRLNRRIRVLDVVCGLRNVSKYMPLPSIDGQSASCLLAIVEGLQRAKYERMVSEADSEADGSLLLHAQHIELGRLGVLSDRELEIAALLGEGLRSKEIAETLGRSVSTIDSHLENIRARLGVQDRAEIISLANIAVLQVEDAKRERVQFVSSRQWVEPNPKSGLERTNGGEAGES